MELSFSDLVEADKKNIMMELLSEVKIGLKGIPADEVMELIRVNKETFNVVVFDLPFHTFTPITHFAALTLLKEQGAKYIKETLGNKHVWVQDLTGNLREARDEEVRFPNGELRKNLFEGKPLTRFELNLTAYTWGKK